MSFLIPTTLPFNLLSRVSWHSCLLKAAISNGILRVTKITILGDMGDATTSSVGNASSENHSYPALKQQLLSKQGPVLPPPSSAPSQSLTHAISSLFLHPSIEAALHLLNDDLVSAHFLVRHMQAAPQYESMMLHGILHRIEGDYDNARAWYRDVKDSEVFLAVWGEDGLDKVKDFVRRIEILRKETKQGSTLHTWVWSRKLNVSKTVQMDGTTICVACST